MYMGEDDAPLAWYMLQACCLTKRYVTGVSHADLAA